MAQPRLFPNRPARTLRDTVRDRLEGFELRQRERDRRREKKKVLQLLDSRIQAGLEFSPPE